MATTTQKREAGLLDATPEKRSYWSIISDYDLKTGICELIDNAIDQWVAEKRVADLRVDVDLDVERQLMTIRDTAGGVREEDLRLLVAPGASKNDPTAASIGIFGVGSKRAVIALAETIAIRTRHAQSSSFQIDIDTSWLESPDWGIPHYRIPDIEPGVTEISLSALRKSFDDSDVVSLTSHLGVTYAWFLRHKNCRIRVNRGDISSQEFDVWAFPKGFEPQRAVFDVKIGDEIVKVEIAAGLIRDRDPIEENYGVYFYCNDRLIVRELRTRDVGYFVTSEAGVPHPDASLCRAIVRLNGAAKWMPWNSSKSAINVSHPIFHALRPTLIQLVSHYSSLSRRLKDDWERKVFKFDRGSVRSVDPMLAKEGKRLVLPPLPKVNKAHVELLKARNKTQIRSKPWTLGLVEAIAAVDIIGRQKLETRNRIALIVLDSNFEIALKEFIVHREDLFPRKTTDIEALFERRYRVIDAVAAKVRLSGEVIGKAKHYYELRNKLIHERATVDVTDADVDNYRETVEEVLSLLFDLRF